VRLGDAIPGRTSLSDNSLAFREFARNEGSSVANDQADGSGKRDVMTLAVTKGAILGTLTSGSTEENAAR